MRSMPLEAGRDFRPQLIDHVGTWLTQRSYRQAWSVVAGATLGVAGLDFLTYQFELCIATLYVAPIAIACWYFGSREGSAVTVGITVLAAMKYPLLHPDPNLLVMAYNGGARAVAFTLIAALVLSLRRLYERVHFLAHRDRMTGVLNKVAFDAELDTLLKEARSNQASLLLTYIDLDGFKAVNDRYGHEAGDTILRDFTSAAAQHLRRTDRLGRLGGDEFATVMILDREADGSVLAGRLHQGFTDVLAAARYPVTCSMGAIIIPPDTDLGRLELLRSADRLMYAAKRGGKNAVRLGNAANVPAHNPGLHPPVPALQSANDAAVGHGMAYGVR